MASLRVCEAAMAPASLIRGRAWHAVECDARAPGGMAHVVYPWPVQEAASKSHDLVSWSCAQRLLATAQTCASPPPTERGQCRIIVYLQMVAHEFWAQFGHRRVRIWGPLDCPVRFGCRVIGQPRRTPWGHCMLPACVDRGQELFVSPIPY